MLAGGQAGGLWVLVLSSVWDGTFSCPSRLWSSIHYPWVQQLSLPLLSHPWVHGRYSAVSRFLGPWNVCFRLLSLWAFVSLKCCNRTCDPIMASLPSSTPTADLSNHTGPGGPELGPLLGVLPGHRLLLLLGARAYLEIMAGGVPMLFAA